MALSNVLCTILFMRYQVGGAVTQDLRMNVTTNTRIIIGASAYASIAYTHTTPDAHHVGTIDMKLPGGRGASADLRRIADEHRERAAREMRYADIAEHAAAELDTVRLTTGAMFPNVVPCDSF